MMKKTILLLPAFLVFSLAHSQRSKDIGIAASIGVNIPVGEFSSTHSVGIGADFSPSRHTFGLVKGRNIAFTYNGGIAYYFGKSETVSGYSYKYPGYFFIHAFGGMFYKLPVRHFATSLLAGPALSIYNGNTRFNIGARLESKYFFKSDFCAGPMINLMWEPGTRSLWSAGLKCTLDL